ncbi:hypothetical protein M426DRAFT_316448 [Hypoxylon sp. CI-4A]|nr:hypothetical protein M426DRAFT_316448 [Hypoxylon sp. CI-4A]
MSTSRTMVTIDQVVAESSSRIPLISITRPSANKGKAKAGKPWVDGPWPLIETPSQTQPLSHTALHIANETAHVHNAMLRGLNALYLQAPFVREPADIADFMFLVQAWSGWVLDHHELKEGVMIPGFEAVLGLESGTLGFASTSRTLDRGEHGDKDDDGDNEKGTRDLPTLLRNVHSYAVATHAQPPSYSISTLQALLSSLADVLVPHLHKQIDTLAQMRNLCLSPASSSTSSSASSSHSHSHSHSHRPSRKNHKHVLEAQAAADKATRLQQIHLAAESNFSNNFDRYVVPPMLVRLRDVTYPGGSQWPQLTVPALHAVADRLSGRHEGAWRFLPCDVWGRPRELPFASSI